MPSGVPLVLRCRAFHANAERGRCNSTNLVRVVGRERARVSVVPSGLLNKRHLYACLDCGHEGWSAHPHMLRLPTEQRDFTIEDGDRR